RFQISDCRFQIADCRLQIAGCRLQVADCRFQNSECGIPNAGLESRIPNSEFQIPNCKEALTVPDFDSLPPGTFCWPELSTTDQNAGVAFYRNLFGWNVNEQPMGPGEMYSMFEMRGRAVAAAYTMRPEERQHGAPPHWNSYVTVTKADDAVKRAQELGGKVLAPAFDVMDAGRMAILQDPTGAIFQVWEPKRHTGARILGEPGALCWTELATRDT